MTRWYILLVSKTEFGRDAHALLGPMRGGEPTKTMRLDRGLWFETSVQAGEAAARLNLGLRVAEFGRAYAKPSLWVARAVRIEPPRIQTNEHAIRQLNLTFDW